MESEKEEIKRPLLNHTFWITVGLQMKNNKQLTTNLEISSCILICKIVNNLHMFI